MDKKEISKAYRIKMQEIRKRYDNNEHITDEEYDKMNRYYRSKKKYSDKLTAEGGRRKDYYEKYYKNSDSHKLSSKKFYEVLREIRKRYDNNEHITDEEYNKINKYYKLNKKVKPEKIEKLEKPKKPKKVKNKIIYSNMTEEQKERVRIKSKKYYQKNKDKILQKYYDNKNQLIYYHHNKNFIISENRKYREYKRIEDLKKLYNWDEQKYIDTMTLNLGYS